MVGLVASDLILRILAAGVMPAAFIIGVSHMHFIDYAADPARFRVPANVISNLKSLRHGSDPDFSLSENATLARTQKPAGWFILGSFGLARTMTRPGANDNASGPAALLERPRFSTAPEPASTLLSRDRADFWRIALGDRPMRLGLARLRRRRGPSTASFPAKHFLNDPKSGGSAD